MQDGGARITMKGELHIQTRVGKHLARGVTS